MPVRRERLAQGEEVFRPAVAPQSLGDRRRGRLDPPIAVPGQHVGVPLAGEDRVEDGQAGDPGQVAQDVVELEVHLGERLLHVLGVGGGQLDQAVAMAQEGPHGTDRLRRAEGGPQEANRVEILEPLAVLHVALPARDVLDVAGFHQTDLDAARLQDLEEGDPVHPGGLHGHGGHAALLEPVREGVQVLREGPEAPDGLRVAIERHTDVDLGGPDVDARGVRVQDRHGDGAGGATQASGHGGLLGEG